MTPLMLLAQSSGITIPSWAVPVLIGLVLAVLGFAWRLAVKAEKSADKLEAAVKQLESLEHRLAVLTVMERTIAVMERRLPAARAAPKVCSLPLAKPLNCQTG